MTLSYEPVGFVVGLISDDESQFDMPWTTAVWRSERLAQRDRDTALSSGSEAVATVRVYALIDVTQ